MDHAAAENQRLEQLRRHRNRPADDPSLAFLRAEFKQGIERPHRQLQTVIALWDELLPAALADHTRLESLRRGVLTVAVDSSTRLYELDRLLRSGLERQIVAAHKGPVLRKIKLRVAAIA